MGSGGDYVRRQAELAARQYSNLYYQKSGALTGKTDIFKLSADRSEAENPRGQKFKTIISGTVDQISSGFYVSDTTVFISKDPTRLVRNDGGSVALQLWIGNPVLDSEFFIKKTGSNITYLFTTKPQSLFPNLTTFLLDSKQVHGSFTSDGRHLVLAFQLSDPDGAPGNRDLIAAVTYKNFKLKINSNLPGFGTVDCATEDILTFSDNVKARMDAAFPAFTQKDFAFGFTPYWGDIEDPTPASFGNRLVTSIIRPLLGPETVIHDFIFDFFLDAPSGPNRLISFGYGGLINGSGLNAASFFTDTTTPPFTIPAAEPFTSNSTVLTGYRPNGASTVSTLAKATVSMTVPTDLSGILSLNTHIPTDYTAKVFRDGYKIFASDITAFVTKASGTNFVTSPWVATDQTTAITSFPPSSSLAGVFPKRLKPISATKFLAYGTFPTTNPMISITGIRQYETSGGLPVGLIATNFSKQFIETSVPINAQLLDIAVRS